MLHGWLFWLEGPMLRILTCDSFTETPCWEDAPSFSTLWQGPWLPWTIPAPAGAMATFAGTPGSLTGSSWGIKWYLEIASPSEVTSRKFSRITLQYRRFWASSSSSHSSGEKYMHTSSKVTMLRLGSVCAPASAIATVSRPREGVPQRVWGNTRHKIVHTAVRSTKSPQRGTPHKTKAGVTRLLQSRELGPNLENGFRSVVEKRTEKESLPSASGCLSQISRNQIWRRMVQGAEAGSPARRSP